MLSLKTLLLGLLLVSSAQFVASRARQFSPQQHHHQNAKEEELPTIGPNLLFSKTISSITVLAVGWEFVVDYRIFNVGDFPTGGNVLVHDPDFDNDYGKFLVLKPNSTTTTTVDKDLKILLPAGEFTVKTPLAPGENVIYSLTAIPQATKFPPEGGNYHFKPAIISYPKGAEMQVGWSSLSHGEGRVSFLSKNEADRLYGSKMKDMILLGLFILCAILYPFAKYKMHTAKYDNLQKLCDEAKANKKILKISKRGEVKKNAKKFY